MDRNIVYPGAIPLDTDLLSVNRNTMVALGFLMRAILGTEMVVDGLACSPTSPASMSVLVSPGSLAQLSVVDTSSYGSLASTPGVPLVKMGINVAQQSFELTSPTGAGDSVNYLIEACLQETDQDLIVLPYYNASNPSQPYSGPTNSGIPQATRRCQTVRLQVKSGVPSSRGTQLTPITDDEWIGLYVVTVSSGQTSITSGDIVVLPSAPFIQWKLPDLRPGYGSGMQSFLTSGTFVVPAGVSRLEVELWGGGSGSFASGPGYSSGGGSGGGYARKRIQNVSPGQSITVTVGYGGVAGHLDGTAAGAGGTSSFGSYVSATGGSLNYLATVASPQLGATPAGVGVNADVSMMGSAGMTGVLNQGGMGGGAPMGGSQNSGTWGVAGTIPGGGASGAGTGPDSNTPFNGAVGGQGQVIVRW